MKNPKILFAAFLVMLPGLFVRAQVTTDKANSAVTESLAQKIVSQCANIQEGVLAAQVYLPAGEVAVAPVPGSAEGKIVVLSDFGSGVEAKDITLIFQKGKLVSMTAKSGIERLQELYDAFAEGKEDFSSIDIGINPDVTIIPGSMLACWMPAGMITIGIGNNLYAGGDNKSIFGYNFHIPGSTLTVDGKVLVDGGALVPVKK